MARSLAAALVLCLIAFPAHAFQIDCDLVRAYVAEHGKVRAIAFALQQGATWKQLKEAEKCLRPIR